MSSSVIRRSYTPPGVPGVWRVPRPTRRKPVTVLANPWLTPPPSVAVGSPISRVLLARGTEVETVGDEAAYAISLPQAYAGFDLTGDPIPFVASFVGVTTGPDKISAQAQTAMYTLQWTYPQQSPPVEEWPEGAIDVEFEYPSGVPIGTATVELTYRHNNAEAGSEGPFPSTVLEVPAADVAEAWFTPAEIGDLLQVATLPVIPPIGSVEQDGVVTFDVGSVFAEPEVYMLIVWDPIKNAAELEYFDGGNVSLPEPMVITRPYQPPRYRYVYDTGPTLYGDWTVTGSSWRWDAGEFLGATFGDFVPAEPSITLADMYQFELWIVPADKVDAVVAGGTPDAGDVWGARGFFNDDDSRFWSTLANAVESDPPEAGSHVVAVWFGPDSNTTTDPQPSTTDPASLVLASLAQNGEG